MTDEAQEFLNWPGTLGSVEVKEINQLVIERVIEFGDDTPFKNFDTRTDGDWKDRDYAPDLRANRMFPTIGLHNADQVAKTMVSAAEGRNDLHDLRLITLRLKEGGPAFECLDPHLEQLSSAASDAAQELQRTTKARPSPLARPILTTIHIRISDSEPGRFDPHVHGLWHIGEQDMSRVRSLLDKWFGQVWIDAEPVRSVKKAAYYIAQGIIDYRNLHVWPSEAFRAVWTMEQLRMVRKAGWLASASSASTITSHEDESAAESVQNALQGPLTIGLGHDHAEPISTSAGHLGGDEQTQRKSAPSKGQLFPFMRPYRPSVQPLKYTVRPTSPKQIDLERYPTLGDIQSAAIAIVEAEQRVLRKRAEVFAAYGLSVEQVDISLARTQAYFNLNMFHPGSGNVPTPEGVAWATKVMEALDILRQAAAIGDTELRQSHNDAQRLPEHLKRK